MKSWYRENNCCANPSQVTNKPLYSQSGADSDYYMRSVNQYTVNCGGIRSWKLGLEYQESKDVPELQNRRACYVKRRIPSDDFDFQQRYNTYYWLYEDGTLEPQHGEHAFNMHNVSQILRGERGKDDFKGHPIIEEILFSDNLVKNDIFTKMRHPSNDSFTYDRYQMAKDFEKDESFVPTNDSYFDNMHSHLIRIWNGPIATNSGGAHWNGVFVSDFKTQRWGFWSGYECPLGTVAEDSNHPAKHISKIEEMTQAENMVYFGNKFLCEQKWLAPWTTMTPRPWGSAPEGKTLSWSDTLGTMTTPLYPSPKTQGDMSLLTTYIDEAVRYYGNFPSFYASLNN